MQNNIIPYMLEPFERLLWNLLCQRDALRGKIPANKAKRLCVLAYCLYFRGVTVQQILLAGMTDSVHPSVIRSTMSKYATSDIRCCVIPKSHIAEDVAGLAPISKADAVKPYYVHQVRYGKTHFNVYELSEYGISHAIYDLLDLPGDFLSGVNRTQLDRLAKQYRKKKSLRLSDEVPHFLAVRDMGAYCYSRLDYRPFVYHTECRFFQNGEFMSANSSHNRSGAFASTAQICDGYVEYMPITRAQSDGMSVYVEQDMGTQSRSYIRKHKLGHYLDFVRYSFRKHPSDVTVLFLLQTRAGFQYPSGQQDETGRVLSGGDYMRYAPALRQEIMIRAYENFGERWEYYLLQELRDLTAATMRGCPAVHGHLSHELELFDAILEKDPLATVGFCLECIDSGKRPAKAVHEQFDPCDQFYFKTRRLEIYEESIQVPGFYETLLEGFSVMFAHNRALSVQMPCLLPELSGVYRGDPMDIIPHSRTNEHTRRFLARLFGYSHVCLDYIPCAVSPERLFRNYYCDKENGLNVIIENISDDLGGRARVLSYMDDPAFSLFHGYLICLVEDDWMAPADLPLRQQRADFLWPAIRDSGYALYLLDYTIQHRDPFLMLPLRVLFVTYHAYLTAFEDGSGIQELAARGNEICLEDWGE